jgi:hypothetical protein
MEELTPEIRHWSAVHPNIGWVVSSYWLPGLAVLLDPLEVPEEVEGVEQIVLSNRHHRRSAFEARERFGAAVRVPRVGLHEFEGDPVEPYDFGEPLVGGAITPYQVTELNEDGRLQWMPDYCFDDITAERESIRAGLARLAEELDFEHLLLAHGEPLAGDGRERLREFPAA